MKIRKYAYLVIPLLCFIFVKPTYAAQSSHTVNFTDADGLTLNFRYQDHSTVDPSGYFEEHDNSGNVTGYTYTWDISENIDVILTQGKYYSGYVNTRINWSTNISGVSLSQATLNSVDANSGMYVYISTISANYIQIQWVFDNYYTGSASTLGTASLNLKFTYRGNTNSPYLNVTNTITCTNNLRGYAGVQNNALTAMIYSAIEQATQPDFDAVLGLLTTIKNQDYTFYSQIITNLGTLHTDLNAILSELDLDFNQVQTILDLFPSYRTQVLQYWQQLLEMNAAQSSAAEEMESQYQDKDNQSGQIIGNLGSVPMPTFSDGDFNILGNTDGTQKANFFGLIALITNNGLVTTILLIVVTGMIVGYVLYGKK